MAGCSSYYCNDLVEQSITPCGEPVAGGGDQAIIFQCGFEPTDPSDGVEIAALIAAGNAALFVDIKVGIPKASPQDATVYVAGQEARTSTYQRTGTWMDANVNLTSDAAYEAINSATGQVIGAVLVHLAEQDAGISAYINPPRGIVFKGSKVWPDDTTDSVHYEYDLAWKSKTDVEAIATPAGVFN